MRVLISASEIDLAVRRLSRQITAFYGERPFTMVCVLTGSMIFCADLMRQIDLPIRVGVIQARSYRGAATRPGELIVKEELLPEIRNQEVLVVDDIFDTGRTLDYLVKRMQELGARQTHAAVLLLKQGRNEMPLCPDFVGFEIPDEFVVGYGLDYQDAYRNLPYIAALDSADMVPR